MAIQAEVRSTIERLGTTSMRGTSLRLTISSRHLSALAAGLPFVGPDSRRLENHLDKRERAAVWRSNSLARRGPALGGMAP